MPDKAMYGYRKASDREMWAREMGQPRGPAVHGEKNLKTRARCVKPYIRAFLFRLCCLCAWPCAAALSFILRGRDRKSVV